MDHFLQICHHKLTFVNHTVDCSFFERQSCWGIRNISGVFFFHPFRPFSFFFPHPSFLFSSLSPLHEVAPQIQLRDLGSAVSFLLRRRTSAATRHVLWALNTQKNAFMAESRHQTHYWCIWSPGNFSDC